MATLRMSARSAVALPTYPDLQDDGRRFQSHRGDRRRKGFRDVAACRRTPSHLVTPAPERGASSHPVQAPIEALGRRTEKNRREEPACNTTDEEGERRRQVDERPGKGGADDGTEKSHRRWGRHQPDSSSVPGCGQCARAPSHALRRRDRLRANPGSQRRVVSPRRCRQAADPYVGVGSATSGKPNGLPALLSVKRITAWTWRTSPSLLLHVPVSFI